MSNVFRFVHPHIVGTFVTVALSSANDELDDEGAGALDDVAASEFERLEQIFSVYRPDSELERWKRGELAPAETSTELRAALREALAWQHRSDGAFHTASGAVSALWRAAAERGSPPTTSELAQATTLIDNAPYSIDPSGVPVPGEGAGWVNLNAFAKGWIVDRVANSLIDRQPGLEAVTINAGGDLCHRGPLAIVVGVENPLRPYDNEPPLVHVSLRNQAAATSGGARRGYRIDDEWFSHVIDPRTGTTVERFASVTIVADEAATADVLATVIGLADADEAIDLADDYGVAAMIVLPDGTQLRNAAFDDAIVSEA